MTSGAIENDTIELAVLKNPDVDTGIVYLALLETRSHFSEGLKLILQTQVTKKKYKPRAWEVPVLL